MSSNQNNNMNNNMDETEPQKLYVGKWTQEEEEYVDGLIENFRAGNITGIPDGTTLRCWLAKKLSCRVKRVSKRYERTGYNGRAQYKNKEAHLSPDAYARMSQNLQDQRQAFLASREQVMQGLAYARGSKRSSRTPGMFARARQAAAAAAPATHVIRVQEAHHNAEALSASLVGLNLQLVPARDYSPVPPTTSLVASNSDLLLRAAILQKLGSTAAVPVAAPPVHLQSSSVSVSALLEVFRVKQQMEQNRVALLERALQSHLWAQAMGRNNLRGGHPSTA